MEREKFSDDVNQVGGQSKRQELQGTAPAGDRREASQGCASVNPEAASTYRRWRTKEVQNTVGTLMAELAEKVEDRKCRDCVAMSAKPRWSKC